MGTIITVEKANYENNSLNTDFDIRSNNASDIKFANGLLSFKNIGASGNFETIANSYIKKAEVIMPIGSPVPTNAIIVGTTIDENYAVMYLSDPANSGNIYKFWKDGHVDLVRIYNMSTGTRPMVPKGSPVTIELGETFLTISYSGYTRNINYSLITGFDIPAIGVLATGLALNAYTFEILS